MAESETKKLRNQIGELATAVFDGSINRHQFDQLKTLLDEQPEARQIYAEFIGLHVGLNEICGDLTLNGAFDIDAHLQSTVAEKNGPEAASLLPDVTTADSEDDPFAIGGNNTLLSKPATSPPRGWSFGMPSFVLLMLIAVTVGLVWLGSWRNREVAKIVQQSVDCHWSDAAGKQIETPKIDSLDWCQLKKGMVKIQFGQGARVLLEGPTQFRVSSDNGLQMRSGRLTAKVPASAHGFTVLAPNVKVVDLGTKFGIDASRLDHTSVQVMTGRVEITTFDPDGIEKDQRELLAKQCLTISRIGSLEEVRFGSVKFPTELSDASIDLVDLVCGGSGVEQKRGYAINCLDGKWSPLTEPFTGKLPKKIPVGSNRYHPVPELPFVDGVFVPGNRRGPIVIDSAGHQFAGFGNKASGQCYDQLMAGATLDYFKTPRYPQRLLVDGRDFTMPPHGLLVMRNNKGITFDLEKIRQANPGMKITKFRSLAANTENAAELNLLGGPFRADLWVIIDGVPAYVRTGLSSNEGTLNIEIPIPEEARFLTLAATEGKIFSLHDWIVFANPTLELMKEEK